LHSNYFWVKIAHLNLLETAHLKFNKDETDKNQVPAPVVNDEEENKRKQDILALINDVPREGSIGNMQENVEVVAVKKD